MRESHSVIYSTEALQDLRGIYAYIAYTLLVPETAQRQVDRIRNEIRLLDTLPSRFQVVSWEPWRSMQMHRMPVDHYSVFYLVNDDAMTVRISRIVYDGQDLSNMG